MTELQNQRNAAPDARVENFLQALAVMLDSARAAGGKGDFPFLHTRIRQVNLVISMLYRPESLFLCLNALRSEEQQGTLRRHLFERHATFTPLPSTKERGFEVLWHADLGCYVLARDQRINDDCDAACLAGHIVEAALDAEDWFTAHAPSSGIGIGIGKE